jgi:hypothetical protein
LKKTLTAQTKHILLMLNYAGRGFAFWSAFQSKYPEGHAKELFSKEPHHLLFSDMPTISELATANCQ